MKPNPVFEVKPFYGGWYIVKDGNAHRVAYPTKAKAEQTIAKMKEGLIRFVKHE